MLNLLHWLSKLENSHFYKILPTPLRLRYVLCLALPGMTESLQLEDDSLLPDYAEITADVSNFSLAGTSCAEIFLPSKR